MNIDEKLALQCLHMKLLDFLDVDYNLLKTLLAIGLISVNEICENRCKESPRDKARHLLVRIPKKGPRAFAGFLAALNESGRQRIAEALRIKLWEIRGRRLALASVSAETLVGNSKETTDLIEGLLAEKVVSRSVGSVSYTESEIYRLAPILAGDYFGNVLIINNTSFDRHYARFGSEHDVQALCKFFHEARLRVHECKDLNAEQMQREIITFLNNRSIHEAEAQSRNQGDSKVHLTMICIMSHGDDGVVYGTDSKPVVIAQIINWMTATECRLLTGMPKWLFIEACRGSLYEDSIQLAGKPVYCNADELTLDSDDYRTVENTGVRSKDAESQNVPTSSFSQNFEPTSKDAQALALLSVPGNSDILVTYSSCRGYKSFRAPMYGSWFVQDFIRTLYSSGGHCIGTPRWKVLDVQNLLTLTNNWLSNRVDQSGAVQTCVHQTSLRKLLFFRPEEVLQFKTTETLVEADDSWRTMFICIATSDWMLLFRKLVLWIRVQLLQFRRLAWR